MWRRRLTPKGTRWLFALSAVFFGVRFYSATQGHFSVVGDAVSVWIWGVTTASALCATVFVNYHGVRLICASVVLSTLMLWSYLVLLLDSPTRYGTAASTLLLAVYVAFSWGRKPPAEAHPHVR